VSEILKFEDIVKPEPGIDKHFLNHKWVHDAQIQAGIGFGFEGYENLMQSVVDYLKNWPIKTAVEIGPGTGVLLYKLLKNGIYTTGIDMNPVSQTYFINHVVNDSRGLGHYGRYYLRNEYLNNVLPHVGKRDSFSKEMTYPVDLLVSIESFEHLHDDEIAEYIELFPSKYVLFSSTSLTTDWDQQWGHINIKTQEQWVDFWNASGFGVIQYPQTPTKWTMFLQRLEDETV